MRLINRVDRHVVRNLVRELLKDGYSLGVWDGEQIVIAHSRDGQAVLAEMFHCDTEHLLVYRDDANGKPKRVGSVQLVYGEYGWDVICDHSTSLDATIDRLNPLIDRFEQVVYERGAV